MARPGDEIAAGEGGRGHLRASHAEREQVIETLKAAFVQGRLTKDELGLRVGQAFASRTYAELAALTADIPAGLAVAQSPRPARTQDEIMQRPGRMMAVATALYAGVWAFTFLTPWPTNSEGGDLPWPVAILFFLSAPAYLSALFIGVVNMVALWREKRSGGQSPRRPGVGGQASQRLPSAGPGRRLPPAGHGHLFRGLGRLSDPSRAVGYLRVSVLNGCRSVLRARKRARLRGADTDYPPVWSAESAALAGEERREMLQAVTRLPRRQREVLVLRYFLGSATPRSPPTSESAGEPSHPLRRGRWRRSPPRQGDKHEKHLLAYSGVHQVTAVNLATGHQASITAAQIPYLDAAYNTAAW